MPFIGDLMGLPTNKHHNVYRWTEPGCKVLFSASRLSDAMSIHLASDKKGLRKLEQAVNDFCEYVFEMFLWCDMIVGKVNRRSIANLVTRCGFIMIYVSNEKTAWVRCK